MQLVFDYSQIFVIRSLHFFILNVSLFKILFKNIFHNKRLDEFIQFFRLYYTFYEFVFIKLSKQRFILLLSVYIKMFHFIL